MSERTEETVNEYRHEGTAENLVLRITGPIERIDIDGDDLVLNVNERPGEEYTRHRIQRDAFKHINLRLREPGRL